MKRMLINATQAEERRLAIVDGQKLLDYEIEIEGREQRKGNIYKAIVTRVEPALEACFVDYGEDRHGFLPFKEISRQYFQGNAAPAQARINDVIREGQGLLIQVEKEERGSKGAALTTFISLAGRYVVLMPNNPRGGGVSRRIEGEDRQDLKAALDQLEYPGGMSIIARTAGIGRDAPELQWDLNYLLKLWSAIDGAAQSGKGAFLIYQESSLVIRAIRDYFNSDIGEILIDTDDIFEQAHQFMSHVMPEQRHRVKRYRDDAPLFSRFQIEHQIETAYSRTVNLPSGGAIVIDQTEALVAVDVNSARAIKGSDIEETATRTNLEAADEVARQARLRDLGGLIVIDFIDMDESKNRREVENRLRDALRQDRARVQFSAISKFGLLEMSRQRLKPALNEGASIPCPRCGGSGHIRDTESSALQILRIIQEESLKDSTAAVLVQVPVEVASFLLNEKRTEITKIELKQRINVLLVPNKSFETPNYKLERLKHDDPRLESLDASYKLAEEVDAIATFTRRSQERSNKQEPVIKGVLPDGPAPLSAARTTPPPEALAQPAATAVAQPTVTSEKGFFGWIKSLFGGGGASVPAPAAAPTAAASPRATLAPVRREGSGHTTAEAREPRAARPESRNGRGERREGDSRPPIRNEPRRGEARTEARDAGRPEARSSGRREQRRDTPIAPEALGADQAAPASSAPLAAPADAGAPVRRERAPRNDSRRRQPEADSPQAELAPLQDAATTRSVAVQPDAAAASEAPREPRERRSRDRYGRERRERTAGDATAVTAPTDSTAAAAESKPTGNVVPLEAPLRSYFNQSQSSAPVHAAHAALQDEPLAPPPPTLVAPPLPAAAPVAAAPLAASSRSLPQVQPFALALDELKQVAQAGGLEWVNSDAGKVAQAQASIAAELPSIHTPRQPRQVAVVDDAALVLVETRKDLSKLTLPFETR